MTIKGLVLSISDLIRMKDSKWKQWFPFYISDFKGSPYVQAMKPAAKAGYIYLLMAEWASEDCTLPYDEEELSILSGLNDDWKNHAKIILKCFTANQEGRLINKRLLDEWNEAMRIYSSKRSGADKKNGKQSVSERTPNADRDTYTLTLTSSKKQEENTIAQSELLSRKEVVSIPLIGGIVYKFYEDELLKIQEYYPAIDARAQILAAAGWCEANSTKRKTIKGIRKFLYGWCSRAQDNPRGQNGNSQQVAVRSQENMLNAAAKILGKNETTSPIPQQVSYILESRN